MYPEDDAQGAPAYEHAIQCQHKPPLKALHSTTPTVTGTRCPKKIASETQPLAPQNTPMCPAWARPQKAPKSRSTTQTTSPDRPGLSPPDHAHHCCSPNFVLLTVFDLFWVLFPLSGPTTREALYRTVRLAAASLTCDFDITSTGGSRTTHVDATSNAVQLVRSRGHTNSFLSLRGVLPPQFS
jgi:hypothetical protein